MKMQKRTKLQRDFLKKYFKLFIYLLPIFSHSFSKLWTNFEPVPEISVWNINTVSLIQI